MRRNPEFARRFSEATAGETQSAVALKLGVTPSYVGQIKRGLYMPGRPVVERFAELYGLDRDEWLALAGYETREASPGEQRLGEWLDRAAFRAAAAVNGAQRLAQGLYELSQRFGGPVPVHLRGGAETLTVAEAERLLADFERQMREEHETARERDDEPIRLDRPPSKGRSTF
jgi:transcriptional regulator with XRE-family HTH domain